ncbi:unnamed protein product [marine sediment metagenome]|uniref:Uncharacterized protein n=2 Tax=marine sediment metagenome TaxID=412755 RepID=X1RLN0_9ZZZZ
MAKIVTKGQRLVTGATNPGSVYSRVISCEAELPAGGGTFYAFTPTVGEVVWLQGINLWLMIEPGGANVNVSFDVFTGVGKPTSYNNFVNYEILLPVYQLGRPTSWRSHSENMHFGWSLRRLFTGRPRWFGIAGYDNSTNAGSVMASFEISEG